MGPLDTKQQQQQQKFAGLLEEGGDGLWALGGHRGMGANVWHPSAPTPIPAPFRENTLASFQRAVQCGASFLEFDVQVTSDGAAAACVRLCAGAV